MCVITYGLNVMLYGMYIGYVVGAEMPDDDHCSVHSIGCDATSRGA